MDLSDQQAAEQAQRGDSHAFRVLVDRHGRSLFRVAFRIIGNEQDAEDVVQETFLRAFKQIHRYDGRASVYTWLCRIATNCSLDLLRSRKTRKEQHSAGGEDEMSDVLERLASGQPSPERLTHSTQISKLLEQALRRLTDMERSAFVLRHYENCDIDEIAKSLGVQPNAAKHSVFRAVGKLRRALLPVWGTAK